MTNSEISTKGDTQDTKYKPFLESIQRFLETLLIKLLTHTHRRAFVEANKLNQNHFVVGKSAGSATPDLNGW